MVQWLRLCAPSAGYPSLILGQRNRSYMPKQRSKVLSASAKTWCSQIKINIKHHIPALTLMFSKKPARVKGTIVMMNTRFLDE